MNVAEVAELVGRCVFYSHMARVDDAESENHADEKDPEAPENSPEGPDGDSEKKADNIDEEKFYHAPDQSDNFLHPVSFSFYDTVRGSPVHRGWKKPIG